MTTRTRIAAVAVTVALALGTTACAQGTKAQQPNLDAPRSGSINKQPMDIIAMSDGFSNVGAKCDGPNRVYVLFHGDDKYGSLSIAPNDPRCTGR